MKIELIKPNESNPRFIKDDKFKKLLKSIKDFPEMQGIKTFHFEYIGNVKCGTC